MTAFLDHVEEDAQHTQNLKTFTILLAVANTVVSGLAHSIVSEATILAQKAVSRLKLMAVVTPIFSSFSVCGFAMISQ